MKRATLALLAAIATTGFGCGTRRADRGPDASTPSPRSSPSPSPSSAAGTAPACPPVTHRSYAPDPIMRERDELFMLLAYAIAYDDWQMPGASSRGKNIAAVLADPEGHPLCWARNSFAAEDDATQHAEVRLLTSYLRSNPGTHADHLRLYATLEPCVMCAGMTLITGVDTVLYGEHAGQSGSVYERLAYDGHASGGYCPYAFSLVAAPAPTRFVASLDTMRGRVADGRTWVAGPERRELHAEAAQALDRFVVQHEENAPVLDAIRVFRSRVPRSVPHAPYRIGCPSFEEPGEAP